MSELNKYLDANYKGRHGRQMTGEVICKSGLRMSVQAGDYHYCTPRENSPVKSYSHYTHFEVGFPTKRVEALMEYIEDADRPTDTVYAYVPREVIESVIEDNGGLVDN
jgi:hypothetical protein